MDLFTCYVKERIMKLIIKSSIQGSFFREPKLFS